MFFMLAKEVYWLMLTQEILFIINTNISFKMFRGFTDSLKKSSDSEADADADAARIDTD